MMIWWEKRQYCFAIHFRPVEGVEEVDAGL